MEDVDSAIGGHLDMEVLNRMWKVCDCTLYNVDHGGRVQVFMYVQRVAELCTACCETAADFEESQCGKCTRVAVKHGPDYVPTKVFVRSVHSLYKCSGWLLSNKAHCLRQVRNYFKNKGEPNKLYDLTQHFAPYVGATRDIF